MIEPRYAYPSRPFSYPPVALPLTHEPRAVQESTSDGLPAQPVLKMVRVEFTRNLQRHVSCPPTQVEAATVSDALEAVFAHNEALRDYVVDERGALRKHMVIFVDGSQITDRSTLTDPVRPDGEIYVMQALSGG